jgi:hypothetical protein
VADHEQGSEAYLEALATERAMRVQRGMPTDDVDEEMARLKPATRRGKGRGKAAAENTADGTPKETGG